MAKVDIAGVKIDAISKKDLLDAVLKRILANQKTFVITPYSEFLYAAFKNPALLDIFNSADFSVADGIGIFWARRYLSLPLTAKGYWGKIIQAVWQIKYSLAAIIFYPSWIKSALPEKIVGADLVWDLAKLANDNNLSIFLLGGFGDTSKLAAKQLATRDSRLKIAGTSNKNPNDESIADDINRVQPDILLVAYGPIKQEKWIAENLPRLNTKLAIGVGGTFDYIAGKKSAPPKFIRYTGLEWLWRLITQPYRIKRILNATFGLVSEALLYKLCQDLPYRKNVVVVIIKNNQRVFIAQRNPENKKTYARKEEKDKYLNYWQLPQGGVGNEDIVTAAKREAEEETGLKNLKFIKTSIRTNTYDFTPSWGRLFDKEYRFRGQTQNIVYLDFLGNDGEIHIDKDELINYKWVNIQGLPAAVHKERLPLVKIVTEDLKNLA